MGHNSFQHEQVAKPNEILRVLVGSTAHGTGEDGQEDRDEMGVCIEPPAYVIGLNKFEQYEFRTQPDHVRSGPGDLDLTIYSLRKWMRLATDGNPSILIPLFVDDDLVLRRAWIGDELRAFAPHIISRKAGKRFLGYMRAQRERLLGTRGGKHTNRPELAAKFGYDTKYSMHMLRLGYQGVELMQTGRFSVPMQPDTREFLKSARVGGITKDEALQLAASLEAQLIDAMESSLLPDEPDYTATNAFLVDAYRQWWNETI